MSVVQGKNDKESPGEVNKAWTSDSSGLASKSIELDLSKSYMETLSQKGLIDGDKSIRRNKNAERIVVIILILIGITVLTGAAIGLAILRGMENSKEHPTPTAQDVTTQAGAECTGFEHRCSDGKCIPFTWKCDGYLDCSDGEDETVQRCGYCRGNLFQCNNGSCINSYRRCNGVLDCSSGEDENMEFCSTCTSTEFRCSDSKCISTSWLCDGERDCSGGEDEQSCAPCNSLQFSCKTGLCISSDRQCDGILDCPGSEDEYSLECVEIYIDPSIRSTRRPTTTSSSCYSWQFKCYYSGRCISYDKKCDGIYDCPGGEDEHLWLCGDRRTTTKSTPRATSLIPSACNSFEFKCNSGTCIPYSWKCDGYRDCIDGEDESVQNCGYCHSALYQCYNGSCINSYKKCDGVRDCSYGEDETFCTELTAVTTASPTEDTTPLATASTNQPITQAPVDFYVDDY